MDEIFTVRKELFDNHLFQTISVAIKLMLDFSIYHPNFLFYLPSYCTKEICCPFRFKVVIVRVSNLFIQAVNTCTFIAM